MTASDSTRAGDVTYTIRGEARPLLLLHASLHDSHDFDPDRVSTSRSFSNNNTRLALARCFAREHDRVLRSQCSLLMAEILADLVTAVGLPPVIISDNSVGGFAAARLAITHPQRV